MENHKNRYDVVICGAGLAGLTLARQLLMQIPSQKILLIDMLKRPLPVAKHKVGESTLSGGGTYLALVLGLKEYLEKNQVEKYGLRYFYGSHKNDFETRAEMGLESYDVALHEQQIDRGVFENDLREMVIKDGASLAEGASIQDIEIGVGEEDHLVKFKTSEKESLSVKARWVIDATGRRQFLSQKLGLREEFPENCSATWARVKGRFDISDLVPTENKEWHDRVSKEHPFLTDFSRYNSTNHMMGYGYWIWVIPLVSGYTSIGVVTHNDYHDFESRGSLEQMKEWLWKHDEKIAAHFEQFEVLDFKRLKDYSYTASKVFSIDRWACTGESGVFIDPYLSPGTDAIALANCYIKELIQSDLNGGINEELMNNLNKEFLDYSQTLTQIIQASYPAFSNGATGSLATVLYFTWSMSCTLTNMRFRVCNPGYISSHGSIPEEEYAIIQKMNKLAVIMAKVIRDWAIMRYENDKISEEAFSWVPTYDIPTMRSFKDRIFSKDSPQWQVSLEKFTDFASGLYLLIIEDAFPDKYNSFPEGFVPNVFAASMKPDQWEKDGVFNTELASPNIASCLSTKEELRKVFLDKPEIVDSI